MHAHNTDRQGIDETQVEEGKEGVHVHIVVGNAGSRREEGYMGNGLQGYGKVCTEWSEQEMSNNHPVCMCCDTDTVVHCGSVCLHIIHVHIQLKPHNMGQCSTN